MTEPVRIMDALICSEPGKLHLETRPAPVSEPGDALVRPRRVGICGTDYHIVEGKHPFLDYPRVMGHELAVEVVETLEGSALSPGEICVVNPYLSCGHCIACRAGKANCCASISVLGVHQDGGMAELLSLPAGNLLPAPGLSADACATVEFLAIGAHAVRRGGVAAGERVLVVGAGPIGLGVALFAGLAGAAVTMMDRDHERVTAAAWLALPNVDALPMDCDAAKVIELITAGDGFDVVLDATGSRQAMESGFAFVAHGGRYVLVSVVKEQITFADPDFHRKEMTLLGSRNATAEDFAHVMTAISSGRVPIDQLITHRTGLAQAARRIPIWAREKAGLIKAVIEID
jgi:2-desacetyl-2-hydroxyethyl bacteriochlorophyllide A dehydrogenase